MRYVTTIACCCCSYNGHINEYKFVSLFNSWSLFSKFKSSKYVYYWEKIIKLSKAGGGNKLLVALSQKTTTKTKTKNTQNLANFCFSWLSSLLVLFENCIKPTLPHLSITKYLDEDENENETETVPLSNQPLAWPPVLINLDYNGELIFRQGSCLLMKTNQQRQKQKRLKCSAWSYCADSLSALLVVRWRDINTNKISTVLAKK